MSDKIMSEIDSIISENKIIATLIQKYKSNISFCRSSIDSINEADNVMEYEADYMLYEQKIICYTETLNDLKKLY